jgi:hypothetical protein
MADVENERNEGIFIVTIILNSFIIIISFYLAFLFIKSKTFHTVPCYNMIIFSLILFLDCILRLLPTKSWAEAFQYIQAFLLSFFDKLILATLTMHSVIFYLGTVYTDTYYKNEKKIFIISFIISGIVSIVLTSIYLKEGVHQPDKRYYFYVNQDSFKFFADIVFDSVFFVPTFFCCLILLCYIYRKKREAQSGLIEDIDYSRRFIRVSLLFWLNMATFTESYLIIFGYLQGEYTDLIYLMTCLIIDLYNSINRTVIKETLKIFCKDTYEEKLEKVDSLKLLGNANAEDIGDKDDDEDNLKRDRTESF